MQAKTPVTPLKTSESASTCRPSLLGRWSLPQPLSVAHHKEKGASTDQPLGCVSQPEMGNYLNMLLILPQVVF